MCDDYSVSLSWIWQFTNYQITHLPNLFLKYLHQMRNLGDHAADRRRVFPFTT